MLWGNGLGSRPPISSPFGWRVHPVTGVRKLHAGCDFTGYALVRSVAAGTVVAVGTPRGWEGGGIQVWVQHDGFLSRSMHLKSAPPVKLGDIIPEGRILGVMGMTGTATGVHHHLEIVVSGAQVDPVPFITQRLGGQAAGGNNRPAPTPQPEEPEMSMQTIRHPNGTIYFVDELGADHLGDYKTADIGLGEFLDANAEVFGGAENVSAREFDIAVAIATRRWERKKAEIVAAVVKALQP